MPTAHIFVYNNIEAKMRKIIPFIVLLFSLLGCTPQKSDTSTTLDITYQGTPFPSIIPTPIESKGTVFGKIVSSSGKSLAGLVLYFGTILPLTPGPDHLVNVDPAASPKAIIGTDGRFIVEDISPGEYVLIIWTPHESRYIPDPDHPEQELIITVTSGQITDAGTLEAPALP
jgi:hypothetical protein